MLRALPTFAEIVRALLAYDLVGFQTETDRESFLGAVRVLWGTQSVSGEGTVNTAGRTVRTGVYSISVDVEAIA